MTLNPLFWTALALMPLQAGAQSPREAIEREAWLMGTRLRVVAESADPDRSHELAEQALREIERIGRMLSTWDPGTPLNHLNASPPGVDTDVEPELAALLSEADAWAGRTAGAFDHRIGALVDAWDLRGPGRLPDEAELTDALARSGSSGLELRARRFRRVSASAWIDSGAFGKGAALRSAASLVASALPGADARLLLDLGGQVLTLGPSDAPWIVHVAHPLHRREPFATLAVSNMSVATTGSSERGRHVLDPRSGRPVEPWGSVTVAHADAFAADVLSTALYVMGPVEGPAWALHAGVAALFLRVTDSGVVSHATPAMGPSLADAPRFDQLPSYETAP